MTPTSSSVDGRAGEGAPPTARSKPQRHRVRRASILVGGVVVLLVVVAVVVLLSTREEAGERTTDEALESFRAEAIPSVDVVAGPEPGVYEATGEGNEFVGFSPLDEPFGPSVPVLVTSDGAACWTVALELNSHHGRGWSFCVGEDGLAQPQGTSWTQRVFPGIEFTNRSTFDCTAPALFVDAALDLGSSQELQCTGTASDLEGTTDHRSTVTTAALETVEVAGEATDVVRVEQVAQMTGGQLGGEVVTMWFTRDSWLPVRIGFDTQVATDTPFGRIDYRDLGSVVLESLTPRR